MKVSTKAGMTPRTWTETIDVKMFSFKIENVKLTWQNATNDNVYVPRERRPKPSRATHPTDVHRISARYRPDSHVTVERS